MSDVRVPFSDGSQRDIVQKAYGLQPGAWEPIEVANHWKTIATGIFSAAHPDEQAGQSHIMLVGISHEADPATVHIPNVVQGPRAIIIRMRSPNFEPEITSRRLSVERIGSGAGVVRYTELMQSYFDIGSDTLKAETAAFGMWPRMLGHGVMRVVEDNPIDGISPHVHILVCRSGDIIAMANDSRKFPQDGSGPIEFKMPPVARSYSEFLAMCQADGIGARGAVA
jgi:hypothetical protein